MTLSLPWSWEVFEWHCWHVSIDKWGSRVFVQLLKAYGLTEQSRVVFADTGSCGSTIESTQSVLWDLATSVCVPLSARSCTWSCVICTRQPLPVCVKFRLCVCVFACTHSSEHVMLCPNGLLTLSAGPQCILLLWTDAGRRSGETKAATRG